MPIFLTDASTLDSFKCDLCGKIFPRAAIHEHHKVKRASGGQDDRENIAFLCAYCHHALHQIEAHLKNDKKRNLIPDLLTALYRDNEKARQMCLMFATMAALGRDPSEPAPSRETDFSAFDTEDLVHLTPPKVTPKIRKLVSVVARQLKGPNGRSVGISGYLRLLVEQDLRRRGFKLD